MEKAVRLSADGEPTRWGRDGGRTPLDQQIVDAREASEEVQRTLFFGFARHLYDNQVRDDVVVRDDPSDNDRWLADLATWFGWSDDLRDEVKKDAMRAAMAVLPHERPD